jgi:hypothetical protein
MLILPQVSHVVYPPQFLVKKEPRQKTDGVTGTGLISI